MTMQNLQSSHAICITSVYKFKSIEKEGVSEIILEIFINIVTVGFNATHCAFHEINHLNSMQSFVTYSHMK